MKCELCRGLYETLKMLNGDYPIEVQVSEANKEMEYEYEVRRCQDLNRVCGVIDKSSQQKSASQVPPTE